MINLSKICCPIGLASLICILWLFLATATGVKSADSCNLEQGRAGFVSRVIDGETFVLEDGLTVRLIGAASPRQSNNSENLKLNDLVARSKIALEELLLGREVQLFFGGTRSDRHRRSLAHVFISVEDRRVWVQNSMIAAGYARTYSFKDNWACIRELQSTETKARAANLGIWSEHHFDVRPAHSVAHLLDLVDTFQIVEGKIISAHAVNNRIYLNFGQIWKEDFTGSISRRDYARFRDAGLDLVALAGRIVRIRGWIEERGGPMIVLTHPEQLEFAGDESGGN